MQPILKTDPHYVDIASQTDRLVLVRTKGSLSGGTRVKLVSANYEHDVFVVAARVRAQISTAPYYKDATHEVTVTLEDLVIRRMPHHPDALNVNQPKPRAVRRREALASKRVFDQLRNKTGGSA